MLSKLIIVNFDWLSTLNVNLDFTVLELKNQYFPLKCGVYLKIVLMYSAF